jgi:hypothetical protein
MRTKGNVAINHQRRREGFVVGLGVAAGALLTAALGQLASPAIARADDFSDIVANVGDSLGYALTDFSHGQTDFGLGTAAGTADALTYDVAGLNNILVSPADDILLGGFETALGVTPPSSGVDFEHFDVPTSLSGLEGGLENDLLGASGAIGEAEAAFGLDTATGFTAGLTDIVGALEVDGVLLPEQALLGLADLAGL